MGQTFGKVRPFILGPWHNAVLACVEVDLLFVNVHLAAGPDNGFAQTQGKAGLEIGAGVVGGQVGHHKARLANVGNDFVINAVVVFLAVTARALYPAFSMP